MWRVLKLAAEIHLRLMFFFIAALIFLKRCQHQQPSPSSESQVWWYYLLLETNFWSLNLYIFCLGCVTQQAFYSRHFVHNCHVNRFGGLKLVCKLCWQLIQQLIQLRKGSHLDEEWDDCRRGRGSSQFNSVQLGNPCRDKNIPSLKNWIRGWLHGIVWICSWHPCLGRMNRHEQFICDSTLLLAKRCKSNSVL